MRYYSEQQITDAVAGNTPVDSDDAFFQVVVLDPTPHDYFVWGADADDAAERVHNYLRHRGMPGCVCQPIPTEPFDFLGEGGPWGCTRQDRDAFAKAVARNA